MMTSRKSAITLGFAMGACAKFGMSGASTVTQLFASKAVDRLANGVQVRVAGVGCMGGECVFVCVCVCAHGNPAACSEEG